MKRIIYLLITLIISINCCLCIKAESYTIKQTSDIVVESFLESLNTNLKIQYASPLYDGKNEINGYLYHLSSGNNKGYIIVFNWRGELKVTEYSLDNDLNLDHNKRIYYDGLLNYYEVDKEDINNSSTNALLKNIHRAPAIDYKKTLKSQTINLKATTDTVEQLNYTLPYICQNTLSTKNRTVNGKEYDGAKLCTQTSSAMLIQYYKQYWNGYSNIASNSDGDLVHSILTYMIPDNSNGSTSLDCFKNKLKSYIQSKGFSATISYQISSATASGQVTSSINVNYPNIILQDIRNERPGIIIIGKNAVDSSGKEIFSNPNTLHAMTIYGIRFTGENVYISVNDPFNSKGYTTRRNILWDTYPYPGQPSAVYAVARVVINK